MAGKEHEILFLLNAALNGNFKNTFGNAQSEFVKLGREVQNLQKLQSNISSYQKQEQAITATTQKLENLRQQQEKLAQQKSYLEQQIRETEAAGRSTAELNQKKAALEQQELRLNQQISNATSSLERQNQKLGDTGQRLREAGVDTNNLAQADAKLSEQIREVQARQEEASKGAQSFGETASAAFGAVGQAVAAAGIAAALHEIGEAYLECVTVAAGFEESMSTVEALSGSTAQEMAELTATAKELGATTKYTALQSADAMGYMGMAGWNAQQMMSGMDGVINLAAASGEDLARVSDIVTDNLTAFGLTAEDTAHFSDVLAAAATKSNTDVSIMGETFKQSASIAGALGYSIEDVAAGVGLMANAGVKGSIAGTALKNTFNGLLEGATLTAAAFGEYEFTAVKADGTMKDFASTIDELRVYFSQMTEAERVNNAMAIAGQRGYNGLLAILNATDADYQSLTNSINNCSGAAKRMADIKMDNLNGQLTLMNSAWEAVQTTIGEQFNPELRRLVEFGTDALSWVNEFIQDHPALVKGIMAAVGAIGAGVAALTGVAAVTKVLIPLMGALTAAVPGVNVIMAVSAAVAGVAAVVTGLTTAMDDGIPSVKELTEAARDMSTAMDEAGISYEQTANQTLATAEVADTYIGKLEEIEAATHGNVSGNQEYQNVLALLLRTMPELSDSISQTTDEYGRSTYTLETSTQALRENAAELKKNAQAQAYQEYINTLYDQYGSVMLEAAENSIKLTQAQTRMETAEKNHTAAVERMNELEKQAIENGTELDREYFALQNSLNGYLNEVLSAQKEIDTYNKAMDEDAGAVAAAEEQISQAEDAVRSLTGAMQEQTGILPELSNVFDPAQERLMNLAETYDNAYQSAYESIGGQMGLFEQMAVEVDTSVGDMISSLESQVSYMATYSENLRRAAELGLSEGLLSQLSDGSTQSAAYLQAIVDSGETRIEELNAAFARVQEGKEDFSGTVAEIQIGLDDAMLEMQQSVQEGVEAMNLPEDAAQSARDTIQAFIDQADRMLPWVQNAYASLGRTAANALGLDLRNTSRGHSGNAGGHSPEYYASGTSSAPPGWAWVGEEGPELIHMQGGETVLPAEVSRKFALLTACQSEMDAYANGTENALTVIPELLRSANPYPIPEIAITPARQQAAAEAARLTEISGTIYNSLLPEISMDSAVMPKITVTPAEQQAAAEAARLTEISSAVYASAPPELRINPAVMPETAITSDERQAAMETERLTEISNAAYAGYSESVYNNAAYHTVSRADYTAYASPREAALSSAGAVEAMPAPAGGGGFAGPVKVEVHIHLEGNASPETVQALEDYVRRGEMQEEFEKAWERMQTDARRRDWF